MYKAFADILILIHFKHIAVAWLMHQNILWTRIVVRVNGNPRLNAKPTKAKTLVLCSSRVEWRYENIPKRTVTSTEQLHPECFALLCYV